MTNEYLVSITSAVKGNRTIKIQGRDEHDVFNRVHNENILSLTEHISKVALLRRGISNFEDTSGMCGT